MNEWALIESAPAGEWIRTRREGEDGENVCAKRVWLEGEIEWVGKETGVTTITHHSFASPPHWKAL